MSIIKLKILRSAWNIFFWQNSWKIRLNSNWTFDIVVFKTFYMPFSGTFVAIREEVFIWGKKKSLYEVCYISRAGLRGQGYKTFPITLLCNIDRYHFCRQFLSYICDANMHYFARMNYSQSPIWKILIVHVEFEYVFMPWKIQIWDLLIAVFLPFLQGQGKTRVVLFSYWK